MYFTNDLMTHSYANCDSSRWRCIYLYYASLSGKTVVSRSRRCFTPFTYRIVQFTLYTYNLHWAYRRCSNTPDAIVIVVAVVVDVVHLAYQTRELSLSHNLIGGVVVHSCKTAFYYKALFIWLLLPVYFRYRWRLQRCTLFLCAVCRMGMLERARARGQPRSPFI